MFDVETLKFWMNFEKNFFILKLKIIKILDDFFKKNFYFEIEKCLNFGRFFEKKFFYFKIKKY